MSVELTPDQLHLEVLKAMGWRVYDQNPNGVPIGGVCGTKPGSGHCLQDLEDLPPITLDLLWQARRGLNPTERESYCEALGDIALEKSPVLTDWELVDATAEQHARAYLSAKGIA